MISRISKYFFYIYLRLEHGISLKECKEYTAVIHRRDEHISFKKVSMNTFDTLPCHVTKDNMYEIIESYRGE